MPSPERRGSDSSSLGSAEAEDDEETAALRELCRRIDTDGDGLISELELVTAVQRDPALARIVLPHTSCRLLLSEASRFDEVEALFEALSRGRGRVKYSRFIEYFRRTQSNTQPGKGEARLVFDLIDTDGAGAVSKLELAAAAQKSSKVGDCLLPHVDCRNALGDEDAFDAVTGVFHAISGGKRRFSYSDLEHYLARPALHGPQLRSPTSRSMVRLFIIGPGFGLKLNPRQGAIITEAGFQVRWCHDLPNPELPTFPVQPYLEQLLPQLRDFQPDILVGASKGGVYVTGLWRAGYWRGPTLLLNAHPTCTEVPEGTPFVLAHGSNDEVYPTRRSDLEKLISTGSYNRCFLYHTANSGLLPTGHLSRRGDRHNMESLLRHDLLPRLLDAVLAPEGPELHVVRTWRERLSSDRLEAEGWLGYSPEHLRRHWVSRRNQGLDERKLFDVQQGSEEFLSVAAVFMAKPREPPAYMLSPQATWDKVHIVRLQRVENGTQLDGSTRPYQSSMAKSLEDQGIDFEPGVHTSWAFHGSDEAALESIVQDPVAGFQPLVSGSRGATLWGLGTYFAREAKYVADGGFCGSPAADGTRQMLMCLLSTGMPCLGDPQHKGVLPYRQRPHRYHCSVDSLSSPEVYIVQHPGAAHAAYLITFA